MKKIIILSLVLILSLNIICANDYQIESISINPGKTNFITGDYQTSIIINSIAKYFETENYKIRIGYFQPESVVDTPDTVGRVVEYVFGKLTEGQYKILKCSISFFILLLLILSIIITEIARKSGNKENKTQIALIIFLSILFIVSVLWCSGILKLIINFFQNIYK